MELSSIHHIAIEVENVDRAIAWYQSHFTCEVMYQDASWGLLKFANISLALVIPEQHPAHLAFLHNNIQQFGEPKTHRDGTRSVYTQDSEGNSVEMLDPLSFKKSL